MEDEPTEFGVLFIILLFEKFHKCLLKFGNFALILLFYPYSGEVFIPPLPQRNPFSRAKETITWVSEYIQPAKLEKWIFPDYKPDMWLIYKSNKELENFSWLNGNIHLLLKGEKGRDHSMDGILNCIKKENWEKLKIKTLKLTKRIKF